MNKIILNKDVTIQDNIVIITEQTETKFDKSQLEMQLRDIQMQKSRLRDQNSRIIGDFNELDDKEKEIKELIQQLESDEPIEVI